MGGFDFAAGATAGVYRLNVAASAVWENLAATAGNVIGFGQSNGVLYSMRAAAADRTLDPLGTVGTLTWGAMVTGPVAGVVPACFSVADNKLYASNGVVALWAYDDQMARLTTTATSPADGATVPIDPVTGRAQTSLPLVWDAIGTGGGLATTYQALVWDTAAGITSGVIGVAAIGAPNRTAPQAALNVPGAGAGTVGAITLLGGKQYGIMIRASVELSGEAILSNFSAPIFITVESSTGIISPTQAGPELQAPVPGTTDLDPFNVGFSWTPMSGVTEFNFILAKDAALTDVVVTDTVTTAAYGPMDLEYNTDYFYAVNASAPTSSVQSVGAFSTVVSPEEAVPAVTIEKVAPVWIWVIVAIGGILVIVVIVLIVMTRKP